MNVRRTRVLHVDDNDDARALLSILLRYEEDLEEVGALSSAERLEEAIRETHPDVLLIDLTMGGRDPIQAIRDVRGAFPALRIVVMSGSSDARLLELARQAGASQLAPKAIEVSETLEAIRGRSPSF